MSRYLITSALPYINGVKHLGNLAGSMLPADVHARFRRAQGHEVLFLCATDEHGTPAELAAAEAGQDARTYCDEQYEVQRAIYEQFALSFDWFGRSSSLENRALTQHFCDRLADNGYIEERASRQVYSVDDGRFLPDRYVEGTCPHCGYELARGDQCDNCSRLLDPTELIRPRSKISGSEKLEVRETAHLYLLQSKLAEAIGAWVERAGDWPALAKSIANKWLDEGLDDRSITRDLAWGVPVTRHGKPRPGFETKVFYVWFDAPIEYIACAQEWAAATGGDWERWWRTDKGADDVTYVEFMGKDNVAFHAVNFPATLIGSREKWKMVDQLKAFNWVTWYGGKFSTSQKRGIFMDTALELLPADTWRWKLMASAPESSDSAFTLTEFRNGVNSDLGNVFGNFINRIVKFTEGKFEGAVPDGGAWGEAEDRLGTELDARLKELTAHHEAMEFRKAATETRAIWGLANEYLTLCAPWTAIKTNRDRAAVGVRTGLNLCVLCATIAAPFIPGTAEKVLAAFGLITPLPGGEAHRRAGEGTDEFSPQGRGGVTWPSQPATQLLNRLAPGTRLGPLPVLFPRIEDAQVAEWEARFGAPAS